MTPFLLIPKYQPEPRDSRCACCGAPGIYFREPLCIKCARSWKRTQKLVEAA